jgi:hypothetical protein
LKFVDAEYHPSVEAGDKSDDERHSNPKPGIAPALIHAA